MKIKHKLTGDIVNISRLDWDEKYLPKKLNEVYEITEQDTVLLRKIENDGKRVIYKKMDRDHAVRMIKDKPDTYDYIEIDVDAPLENNVDAVLRALDDAYPGTVPVYDYAERKLDQSDRDQQIIVDTLIEEKLAKPIDESRNFMGITTKGRKIIQGGGYILYRRKENEEDYSPKDKLTESEVVSIHARLDELLAKMEKLQVGQTVLYEELSNEIEEIKKIAKVIGKKNLGEIITGKFVQWGLGELTEKGKDLLFDTIMDRPNLIE